MQVGDDQLTYRTSDRQAPMVVEVPPACPFHSSRNSVKTANDESQSALWTHYWVLNCIQQQLQKLLRQRDKQQVILHESPCDTSKKIAQNDHPEDSISTTVAAVWNQILTPPSLSSDSNSMINHDNMMPTLPNIPSKSKHFNLSTTRINSSIPKGDGSKVWEYPSSLQFYKSMELRNKNPEMDCMDDIVIAHNAVNEETWKKILEWEKLHESKCRNPVLTRFVGRYDDLSIKAQWKMRFFTAGRPFDRHDWYIDRCGKTIRYIIDYYDDPKASNAMEVTLDVRPAPDTLENLYDRIIRRPFLAV